jgi:S-DNA-T family DNA segregation ATPase FtsK/SpoIIIE
MTLLQTVSAGLGVAVALVVVLAAAGRWSRRVLMVAGTAVVFVTIKLGAVVAFVAACVLVLVATGWRFVSPRTFRRFVVRPVRFSRRRSWYREHWADLMLGHRLGRERRQGDRVVTVVPRLRRPIRCGVWGDRLWVRPLVGQSIEDWETETDALAIALGALGCRVALDRPGTVRLEVRWGDPLAAMVPSLPVPSSVDLAAVPVGLGEDGSAWTIRLTGNHVLIAGVTAAGKSSVVWSLIRGIAPAVRDGVAQLWGVDPKGGMELAPGRPLFARFGGAEVIEMVELLEEAVEAMRVRAARYAGHHRKHEPTEVEPLIVVVVDEMAFLTAYVGERDLRDRVNKALAVLLTQGRAVGLCVVAALQDPRKEVIGYRNLFPTKIALRLDERTQVDMVLGDGARAAGARCDQIPDSSPGVAYVKVDGIREPQRVRAAYVTDADIAELARTYSAPLARETA